VATTTEPDRRSRESRRSAALSTGLTVATALLATVGLGALLPSAVAAWTTDAAPGSRPVSIRLEGALVTTGLDAAPTQSLLTLHNDGPDPVRWTLDPRVEGERSAAVTMQVWVAQSGSCEAPGVLLQPGRWSATALASRGELALCVRISDDDSGRAGASARPGLSVRARNA
jgi:hypothetical protein